jgi:Plasma-membrane choline transporter.
MTTSFGSICFGSLLVAIIQALRQIAEQARQNDDVGQLLACCIDCILSCIQSIIEYFNKWAFVYVGVYGYGYCEAGKSVIQLFKDRGWEAVIADDLVGMVLFFLSLIVGLVTAGVGVVLVKTTDLWADFAPGEDAAMIFAGV